MTPEDLAAVIRRAQADAWLECIAWFAIQGPLRDTPRIPSWLLANAEEENPYDTPTPKSSPHAMGD